MNGLIILDGFGEAIDKSRSAVEKAHTPFIYSLFKKYPHTLINASEEFVGLPKGQMGNSEVGHLNIGAGRIVYQELTRITKAIKDGDFFANETLKTAMTKDTVHIFGLLSDGGVHSHIEHIFALIKMAKDNNVKKCVVHCFLDGRDVPPTSATIYIKQLQDYLKELDYGQIGTVIGRYYAMDRDKRFERVEIAYNALRYGGKTCDIIKELEGKYAKKETDEFVLPIFGSDNSEINNGDAIIFANFRPDRARQITAAFSEKEFEGFKREPELNVFFVNMTRYDDTFKNVHIAFPPTTIKNTFGEYVSSLNLRQLRIAETEKYAHVTFFFNGGVEEPNPKEDRILIKSPSVATYDLKPEMSAFEVTDKLCEVMENYDVFILNFANPDMVGHTGDFNAAVKACETVDTCLEKIVTKLLSLGGTCIVTADHGNADIMMDEKGQPFTSHTTNQVPFIVVDDKVKELKTDGKLCDVMPTLLTMMNIEKPKEMTGISLIKK